MPDELDFKSIYFGQSILRYSTPQNILDEIKTTYKNLRKKKQIPLWNKYLAGKIKNEHSLFYNANDTTMKKFAGGKRIALEQRHNFLSENILSFFKERAHHYLKWNNIKNYKFKLHSVWINEMVAGEYNPIHIHSGDIYTGLSSVMFLDIPKSYGKEIIRDDRPANGKINILSNSTGQFAKTDYEPKDIKEGDFFLFPYDIRHTVYPFQGKGKRRTLVVNIDVHYDHFFSAQSLIERV